MPGQYNDLLDDPLHFERDESFRGGVDTFARASLLSAGQYARAINAVVQDNHEIGTRPGWATQGDTGVTTAVQGAGFFDIISGGSRLQQVVMILGNAAKTWDGTAWTAQAGYTPSGNVTMMQGNYQMLLTDGVANMHTWNGTAFTTLGNTTTATGDAPVGATILCWHTFRAFASGRETDPDTIWAGAIADFTTGAWNHVDFKFKVGEGDGQPITALASLQSYNLAVFKSDSVWLVNTDPTKTTAADWTVQLLSGGLGCVGKRAWCYAGNDVLFMSSDGVRSLNRMAGAAGQYEVTPPISQPMQYYINRINWERAGGIVAQNYRQRCIFWVPLDNEQTNTTGLVYNTRLGIWEGIWTGPNVAAAFQARFFDAPKLAIATTGGKLDVWQDAADQLLESTTQDEGGEYATTIRLRSSQHGEPVNGKDAYYFEARLRDVTTDVGVRYVVDEIEAATFSLSPPAGAIMGEVSLDFNLAPEGVITARKSLDGLPEHNENYLEFYNQRGRFTLKSVTRAAFINTLQNE